MVFIEIEKVENLKSRHKIKSNYYEKSIIIINDSSIVNVV